MRRLALIALLLVAGTACESEDRAGPQTAPPIASRSPSPPPSFSPSPTPSPTAGPRPIPPAWAEPIAEDLSPAGIPDAALVPPGAELTGRLELAAAGGLPDQIAVTYASGADPFAREHGFAVWERYPEPPAWSVVLAFVDPPERGVLGIRLQAGDLTGDGHEEVLAFEETGGTGACGRWRVVTGAGVGARVVFKRSTCDAELLIRGGALRLREAIYEPGDPHCCPSAFRYATLEWDGEGFVETSSRVEPMGT